MTDDIRKPTEYEIDLAITRFRRALRTDPSPFQTRDGAIVLPGDRVWCADIGFTDREDGGIECYAKDDPESEIVSLAFKQGYEDTAYASNCYSTQALAKEAAGEEAKRHNEESPR